MDNTIKEDFADFVENCELFNSLVQLSDPQSVLKYDGKCIYDTKPMAVINSDGMVYYQGHKSILTFSLADLTFMPSYFSLKGYKVTVTDNNDTINYTIVNSSYSSNVGSIYCELKEV